MQQQDSSSTPTLPLGRRMQALKRPETWRYIDNDRHVEHATISLASRRHSGTQALSKNNTAEVQVLLLFAVKACFVVTTAGISQQAHESTVT
jgi:hypothetical protein